MPHWLPQCLHCSQAHNCHQTRHHYYRIVYNLISQRAEMRERIMGGRLICLSLLSCRVSDVRTLRNSSTLNGHVLHVHDLCVLQRNRFLCEPSKHFIRPFAFEIESNQSQLEVHCNHNLLHIEISTQLHLSTTRPDGRHQMLRLHGGHMPHVRRQRRVRDQLRVLDHVSEEDLSVSAEQRRADRIDSARLRQPGGQGNGE